jgi:hypothetical protein
MSYKVRSSRHPYAVLYWIRLNALAWGAENYSDARRYSRLLRQQGFNKVRIVKTVKSA